MSANKDFPGEKAGRNPILVKVMDIFGNDTSQAFDVEINKCQEKLRAL
ncbi:MAG: hypothetical protein QME78_07020 [Thermodesulfobacteriota bacterium]|nr:hypothetical protein [Thermodesulfobacteriota bacterium]